MNKSLSVFLSVLLCVVLYVGVLLLRYTTDESDYWQSSQVYTSSAPAGAPAVSFGVGANGDVLAVPMSSRYSSRERYLQPSWRSTGVANLQVFSRSANSTGMLSHPSLQGGDGGRLFTHMSSSQTMKSFGGGNSSAGVSVSGGVVSSNSQSPIANNQLPVLNLPSPMFASQQMLADAPALAMYEDMSAPRGMAGRRDVPSIGGESDEGVFNKVLINICGSLNFGLSYRELKDLFYAVYGFGTAPISWPQFWAWYQQMSGTQDSPVGDILPLLLLSFVAIIAKLLKSINLKLQNHSSENSK